MRRATITKTLLWCRWWRSLLVDAWSLSYFDGSSNRKGKKKERHNSCPQTRFSTESCDKGNHVLLPDFISVTSYRRIVLHTFEILSVAKCISSFVSIKGPAVYWVKGGYFKMMSEFKSLVWLGVLGGMAYNRWLSKFIW